MSFKYSTSFLFKVETKINLNKLISLIWAYLYYTKCSTVYLSFGALKAVSDFQSILL